MLVWLLSAASLTALAQSSDGIQSSTASASAPNAGSAHRLDDPLADAVAWMLEQPEAGLRAAALLSPAAGSAEERRITILREAGIATEGAAMLWLAHACRANGLSEECIEEGLDQAIVRNDGSNLYARMALHDERELPRLILASGRETMYFPELIESWYRGVSAVGARVTAGQRLVDAEEIASTWTRDAISYPLLETCLGAGRDNELERACNALVDRLIRSATNSFESWIGTRARRPGRPTEAEREAHSRIRTHTNCLQRALRPEIEAMDDPAVRRFLGRFKRAGEFEAWARLASTYAIECPEQESRLSLELQRKAEFDAMALERATAMLDDDRERVRAAGLVHLLIQQSDVEDAPDDRLEALEGLMATSTDSAVLFWLAKACVALGRQHQCIETGLDASIIEHDRGNFYSRILLHDPERIPELLGEDALHFRSYFNELAALWYSELEANRTSRDSLRPQVRLARAWTLAGFADSPDLLPIFSACGESGDAETNDCSGLAEQLLREGRTGTERLGGITLLRRLAERSGDRSEGEELFALYQRANRAHGCISLALWRARKLMGVTDARDELTQRIEQGEWITLRNASPTIDSGCPDLPTDAELLDAVGPVSP